MTMRRTGCRLLRGLCVAGLVLIAPLMASAGWFGGGQPTATKARIAVLAAKGDPSADGFGDALKALDWPWKRFDVSEAGREELRNRLGEFDIVLVGSDLHPAAPADAAWRDFVAKGGCVVVPDIATDQVAWVAGIVTNGGLIVRESPKPVDAVPYCVASGRPDEPFLFPAPPEPLPHPAGTRSRFFADDNHCWAAAEWILTDYDGRQATTLCHRLGKGSVVVSTRRWGADFLACVARYRRLARAGLRGTYVPVSHNYDEKTVFGLGYGRTSAQLVNMTGTNLFVEAVLSFTNGRETRRFVNHGTVSPGDFNLDVAALVDLHGTVRGSYTVRLPETGFEEVLAEWTADLPGFLTVVPPAYRGMISTARRDKDVHLRLHVEPGLEPFEGASVELKLVAPSGRQVSSTNVVLLAREIPVTMALAADAPPGVYSVTAVCLSRPGRTEEASTTFKIVPVRPGQVFVDQDRTFLHDGKPFFPLGLYHVEAKDIDRIADLGVNCAQVWAWQAWEQNLLDLFAGKGILGIYESDIWERIIYGKKGWETDPAYPATAKRLKTHRGLGAWYIADEPGGGGGGLDAVNRIWHDADEDHPTYVVYCNGRKAVSTLSTSADVIGIDSYPVGGNFGQMTSLYDVMTFSQAETGYRFPIVAVPQAFGHETAAELRGLSYQCFVSGVQGLVWYCWKEAGDRTGTRGIGNYPEKQKAFKAVIAELNALAPAMMEPGGRSLASRETGTIRARVCGSAAMGRRLVCANGADEARDETLEVPEIPDGTVLQGLFGGKDAKVAKGILKLALPPYGTAAYAW